MSPPTDGMHFSGMLMNAAFGRALLNTAMFCNAAVMKRLDVQRLNKLFSRKIEESKKRTAGMVPVHDEDDMVWVAKLFKKANGKYSPLPLTELVAKRGGVAKIETLLQEAMDEKQIQRIQRWAGICPGYTNLACITSADLGRVVMLAEKSKMKVALKCAAEESGERASTASGAGQRGSTGYGDAAPKSAAGAAIDGGGAAMVAKAAGGLSTSTGRQLEKRVEVEEQRAARLAARGAHAEAATGRRQTAPRAAGKRRPQAEASSGEEEDENDQEEQSPARAGRQQRKGRKHRCQG